MSGRLREGPSQIGAVQRVGESDLGSDSRKGSALRWKRESVGGSVGVRGLSGGGSGGIGDWGRATIRGWKDNQKFYGEACERETTLRADDRGTSARRFHNESIARADRKRVNVLAAEKGAGMGHSGKRNQP